MLRNHTRQSHFGLVLDVLVFPDVVQIAHHFQGRGSSYSDVCRAQFAVVPRYLNLSTCCSSFPLNSSPSFTLLCTVCSDLVHSNIHSVLESLISCPYFELTLSTLSKRTWACLRTCVKRPKSSAKRRLLIVLYLHMLRGSQHHRVPLA